MAMELFDEEVKRFIDKLKGKIVHSKKDLAKSTCECDRAVNHEQTLNNILGLVIDFEEKMKEGKSDFEDKETLDCKRVELEIFPGSANQTFNNPLILNSIFGFLNLDSIKSCRLVNSTWKEQSKIHFKKNAKVSFSIASNLSKFRDAFKDADYQPNIFEFKEVQGEFNTLKTFLQDNYTLVKELKLENITFKYENVELGSLNASKLIGPNVRKLELSCEKGTKFKIDLERLQSINNITLRFCILILDKECKLKITPKFITLVSVMFAQEKDKRIDPVFVNDFLNFDQMNELRLSRHPAWPMATKSVLINLSDPTIKINTLRLNKIDVDSKITAKIKRQSFLHTNLDLSMLPETLEYLSCVATNIASTLGEIHLPNLKHLKCCIPKTPNIDAMLTLYIFIAGTNLTKVHLYSYEPFAWSFSTLPKTVDTLILENIIVDGQKKGNRLKTLYLRNYEPTKVDSVLEKFPVDKLLLKFSVQTNTVSEFYSCVYKIHRKVKSLIVGPLLWWSHEQFQTSQFSVIVDKKAEYYLFENGEGKGLCGNPFDDFENIHMK